ncbi:hypothetical protein KQX63_02770 [Rhodopseudomonas palustris]|uniref:hypothetical protein n=1 Tax=Rhodopseudomonas palustris TaxID=1076 RepID=UPI0021F32970|nr:hypothetical protein [Rhodopseudomonas palustris]UYO44977.1 hypothetical protein KQX63_02770 [Rhodopseudomonas palustris]
MNKHKMPLKLNSSRQSFLRGAFGDSFGLMVCAAASIAIAGRLIYFANHGYDFTDEGFYLNLISNPYPYNWSVTEFGYVYHPLFKLFGGSISWLRRANVVVNLGLAWGLTFAVLGGGRSSTPTISNESNWRVAIAAAGIATCVLTFFHTWLLTPNYNSLALQAILITAIGLALHQRATVRAPLLEGLLIGLGGGIAFLAKPTTALALAVAVVLYLIITSRLTLGRLASAFCGALFVVLTAALTIDGSIAAFVERLRVGFYFANLLSDSYSFAKIFRLDTFHLTRQEKIAFVLLTILVVIATLGSLLKTRRSELLAMSVSSTFVSIIAATTLGGLSGGFGETSYLPLLFFAPVLAALVLVFVRRCRGSAPLPTRSDWALALLLVMLPHVFSVGSNRNYWEHGGAAALFWLLAGVVVLAPVVQVSGGWGRAVPMILSVQALTSVILRQAEDHPYRHPGPIAAADHVIEMGATGSRLFLAPSYAAYVESSRAAARSVGLMPGVPVIDLTGQSPGLIFALGAVSIGQAWMIGDYPGSTKLASAALARMRCDDLAAAWLLIEPNGPRSLPDGLVTTFGARASEGYAEVASWFTPAGAGGYAEPRLQILKRPLDISATREACYRLRQRR